MLISAVDVGSARARAAIFGPDGRLLARASYGFAMLTDGQGQAGYDFAEIWQAVADALDDARSLAGAAPDDVTALAFDATCSLYVDAPGFAPDVIAWHDHRATAEADEFGRTGHPLTALAGGRVSPEMQTPKLMWLARNRPDIWPQLTAVRDLCDQLAFAATGREVRSLCAMAAKWPYIADAGGWQTGLMRQLGIGDLPMTGEVLLPGTAIGPLSKNAADRFGLTAGCMVATGLIDAFAGTLGAAPGMPVLIAGTSNCIMARDVAPRPAVWGPYPNAILPDKSVSEGGQSATGWLLERLRQLYPQPQTHGDILTRLQSAATEPGAEIHILPDLKGNRTPFADPLVRGVIHGAALDHSPAALDALYWRAAVGIALGARQVIQHLGLAGLSHLGMTGGQARAPLMRQLYADVTGAEIYWQPEDAVLRGTAIAAFAPFRGGLRAARAAFAQPSQITTPNPAGQRRRDQDWRIYQRMQQHRAEIDAMAADIAIR